MIPKGEELNKLLIEYKQKQEEIKQKQEDINEYVSQHIGDTDDSWKTSLDFANLTGEKKGTNEPTSTINLKSLKKELTSLAFDGALSNDASTERVPPIAACYATLACATASVLLM
jgi:hypothetical protein